MICVIRRLALTVSDVCLKLDCFQSTSTYTARRIRGITLYSVSQKNPPPLLSGPDIFHFFHKRLRIFNRFLYTYYTFLSTLDYKFLFNYPDFDEVMPY